MSEERVEVWLRPQVKNLWIVRVIEVSEDAQQLSVDVLHGGREVWREIAT